MPFLLAPYSHPLGEDLYGRYSFNKAASLVASLFNSEKEICSLSSAADRDSDYIRADAIPQNEYADERGRRW